MTIITKPFGVKQPASELDGLAGVENGPPAEQADANGGTSDKLFLLQTRARRMSSVSAIFLFLSALCVLCMGIIGGVVIYRAYVRSQMQRMHFHGFCGVPYDSNLSEENELLNMLNDKYREMASSLDNFGNTEKFQNVLNDGDENDSGKERDFFQEELDMDLQDPGYININVPDFRDGRSGRFLHDFKNNQTAIIDQDNRRCFVMPLDRNSVLPPQSLADLIQKMYRGYYEINTTTIRKNMRVVTPALSDLSSVSPKVQEACVAMKVYQLEKFEGGVFKRSASLPSSGKFGELPGNNLMEYNLVNIHELD